MTIRSTYAKAGPYTTDGVQTDFPFDFEIKDTNTVAVYLGDSLLPKNEGYTVTKTADGGIVAFAVPPEGGSITILRDMPFEQNMDLKSNESFLPEVIEDAFDKICMTLQQIKEIADRHVSVAVDSIESPSDFSDRFLEQAELAIAAAGQAAASAAEATRQASLSQAGAEAAESALARMVEVLNEFNAAAELLREYVDVKAPEAIQAIIDAGTAQQEAITAAGEEVIKRIEEIALSGGELQIKLTSYYSKAEVDAMFGGVTGTLENITEELVGDSRDKLINIQGEFTNE